MKTQIVFLTVSQSPDKRGGGSAVYFFVWAKTILVIAIRSGSTLWKVMGWSNATFHELLKVLAFTKSLVYA